MKLSLSKPRTTCSRRRFPGMALGASRLARGAAILAACATTLLAATQAGVSEYDVKAAYVFNFGKFVRFGLPDALENRPSFDICVVGKNPFGQTLAELTAGERLDGKPVRVEEVKTPEEARNCAIAYISSSEEARVRADLDALHGQRVLTVSDAEDFLQSGGMIQLVNVADHIRFAVNMDAVQRAQLTLSAELLKVALAVNATPPAGGRP